MNRGHIQAVRRFLDLKSVRENPPAGLRRQISDPDGDGEFFRTAPLTGAESYQVYGAAHIVRRFGDIQKDLLRWLILYILVESGNGHIRISREDMREDFPLWLSGDTPGTSLHRRIPGLLELPGRLDSLLEENPRLFSPLPGGRTPVVISADDGYFYLLKRWRYEKRFLALLDERVGEKGLVPLPGLDEPDEAVLQAGKELAGNPDYLIGEETLQAARMTAGRLFSIITGGPGTGKTTILGGLLRILLTAAASAEAPSLRIRLCAPTGRAANRMEESLRGLLAGGEFDGAFSVPPCTLHKLLGLQPGSPPRFHRNRPVPADLVVVDEASMVDLNLMYYLLDALPAGCRLLLVGDRDQLPSVEAGALLSDFLNGRDLPGYRLDGGVLSLSRVHRNSGAILEGAGLIIRGDKPGFDAFLRHPDRTEAAGAEPAEGAFHYIEIPGYREFLEEADRRLGVTALRKRIPPFRMSVESWENHREDIAAYFRLFRETVILSPSRKGLFGIRSLNRGLSALAAPSEGPVFHGQPVMITRNDYERDLYNGDRGVVLSFGGVFYAFFEDSGTEGYRHYPVSLLGDYETAFAQTIHKSQGSEYGDVLVVIPEGADRLLSREILYTAVTRARKRVLLYSRTDLVEKALDRGVRRHSGIREFMAGTLQ